MVTGVNKGFSVGVFMQMWINFGAEYGLHVPQALWHTLDLAIIWSQFRCSCLELKMTFSDCLFFFYKKCVKMKSISVY